jgi:hypothetical protein
MKKSKFTESQIAFILKQADDGMVVAESAVSLAFRTNQPF